MDPNLDVIRDHIAAKIRISPEYKADPRLCEYLIKCLAVTQPGDIPTHFICLCSLQDSRGGISFACGGSSLEGFEESYVGCCTVKVLHTVTQPIFSNIKYGEHITNVSGSNVRDRCPTVGIKFERCPPATPGEIQTQITILDMYAEGINLLTNKRLAVVTLAGNGSNVVEILNQLNPAYSDCCTSTTHAQNLATKISTFTANNQRLKVTQVVKNISDHLLSRCLYTTILKAAIDDEYLFYVNECHEA